MKVERDPANPRWVRKPVGPTCAWCLNLAANLFSSEASAARSHGDCDCVIIILFPGEPDPDWLVFLLGIVAAAKLLAGGDDAKDKEVCYWLRRLHPELVTDGVEPELTSGQIREYLEHKFGIQFEETITDAELSFYAKFAALGNHFTPIPRNPPDATNDFFWHEVGLEIDVKSLKPSTPIDLKHIARPINDEFKNAARLGKEPVKFNFIVDIGDRPIGAELLNELRGINHDYPYLAIQRLWIMSFGQLIEVPMT